MPADAFRMFQLAAQGFCCSQILLILGLEEQGKENPDLVKAMQGLCGGMGRSGKTCGAVTGGACLIGLAAGKGTPTEQGHRKLNGMVNELLEWFENLHGGIECAGILDFSLDEGSEYPVKCGSIVATTFDKVQEIIATYADNPEFTDEEQP